VKQEVLAQAGLGRGPKVRVIKPLGPKGRIAVLTPLLWALATNAEQWRGCRCKLVFSTSVDVGSCECEVHTDIGPAFFPGLFLVPILCFLRGVDSSTGGRSSLSSRFIVESWAVPLSCVADVRATSVAAARGGGWVTGVSDVVSVFVLSEGLVSSLDVEESSRVCLLDEDEPGVGLLYDDEPRVGS
jgi:hypothetical protein